MLLGFDLKDVALFECALNKDLNQGLGLSYFCFWFERSGNIGFAFLSLYEGLVDVGIQRKMTWIFLKLFLIVGHVVPILAWRDIVDDITFLCPIIKAHILSVGPIWPISSKLEQIFNIKV